MIFCFLILIKIVVVEGSLSSMVCRSVVLNDKIMTYVYIREFCRSIVIVTQVRLYTSAYMYNHYGS